jgi:hypothetical protein
MNRYLEHLAEENKKTFGEGKLDCCQLNSGRKQLIKNDQSQQG